MLVASGNRYTCSFSPNFSVSYRIVTIPQYSILARNNADRGTRRGADDLVGVSNFVNCGDGGLRIDAVDLFSLAFPLVIHLSIQLIHPLVIHYYESTKVQVYLLTYLDTT